VDLFEASRAFRVLRVVTIYTALRNFMTTMADIFKLTMYLAIIYAAITYSFACVGMFIFGDVPAHTPGNDGQIYSFQHFGLSCLALFQTMTGNNYNSVLYPNAQYTSRWTVIFFIGYHVICTTILGDLISGIIIESFCIAQEKKAVQKTTSGGRSTPQMGADQASALRQHLQASSGLLDELVEASDALSEEEMALLERALEQTEQRFLDAAAIEQPRRSTVVEDDAADSD
jgi:hypothetical protein